MKFDYATVPREDAYAIRERFIDAFVDTSHDQYVRYIKNTNAKDVVHSEDYMYCYLWDCLKEKGRRIVDFYAAIQHLCRMSIKQVFVMWDIRPARIMYPTTYPIAMIDDCFRHFRSDDMIMMSPKELGDVLFRDHSIIASGMGDVLTLLLPEDLYVFDDSLTWYIAFTHEEYTKHNEKRLCYSNVKEILPIAL